MQANLTKAYLARDLQTSSPAACSRTASSAKLAADEAVALASNFENEGASRWELLVQELPVLRANLQTTQAQVEAAQAHHQEATAYYSRLENDARTRANDEILALEKSKEPHRTRLSESLAQINAAESEALRLCDEEFSGSIFDWNLAQFVSGINNLSTLHVLCIGEAGLI